MKIIKNILKVLIGLFLVLFIIYIMGPRPEAVQFTDALPTVAASAKKLEAHVKSKNNAQPLKTDNGAQIVWHNDSIKGKTPYALVYVHGFSASQMEGAPIHRDFAERYGMNLYLARVAGHGIKTEEPFIDLSPNAMLRSAEEALAIGHQLGEKVILMSCSTGGTLSLYLASQFPSLVDGIILYSPNINIADPSAVWLTRPWGLKMAQTMTGSKYNEWEPGPEGRKYWYAKYRIEGLVALKALVNATMTEETFEKITQPLLVSYYYKNEKEKDDVVSIPRMKEMFAQINTASDKKWDRPIPNANTHIIASSIYSKDLAKVTATTYDFAAQVLGLQAMVQAEDKAPQSAPMQ